MSTAKPYNRLVAFVRDCFGTDQRRSSKLARLTVALSVAAAYAALFLALYPYIGGGVSALVAIPVVVAAWLGGTRIGAAAGLATVVLNTVLFNLIGTVGWDALIRHKGLPGTVVVFLIGIMVGYLRDLRERLSLELEHLEEVQSALRQSERGFKAMFETSSEGVHLIDVATGGFIAVNPAMCEMFGYTETELLGTSPKELVSPEDAQNQERALGVLLGGGELESFQGVRLRKDGSRMHVLISAKPLVWQGERVVYGTLRDITPLKIYQEELQRKNRQIMDITNMVSHDLRNPLSGLKGIWELLLTTGLDRNNEDDAPLLESGKEALEYMEDLVEDLLECSRLETGRWHLDPEEIRVQRIVQQVLVGLEKRIGKRGIKVATERLDVSVRADRRMLTRIFSNLIGNAVSYLEKAQEPEIRISRVPDGRYQRFSVADNGMGIPADTQGEVFEKFTRARNALRVQGTGLGLPIAKAAVEAHGGKIWFESTEGKGTTFYFTIPA